MFILDRQVVYQCEGCSYNVSGECGKWLSPEARFHISRCIGCGLATHIISEKRVAEKLRLGQQKSKKFKKRAIGT